jgi:hypothetical protein
MKTPILLTVSGLFLVLGLLASLPAMSQDEYYSEKTFAAVMYPAKEEPILWLCLEQYKTEEKITVQLVNEQGKVLFDEVLYGKVRERNAYRQKFDISELKDGKYTFRLSTASRKEEFIFDLSTPSLQPLQPTRLIAIK